MRANFVISAIAIIYSLGISATSVSAQHWSIEPTDSAHTFILTGNLSEGEVAVGANQGGWWSIVGASVWSDDSTIVEAWPDDPDTEELDGFLNSQEFRIFGFDQAVGLEYEIPSQVITSGDRLLVKGGISSLSLALEGEMIWRIPSPKHWVNEWMGMVNHSFIIMDSEFLNNFDEIAIATPSGYIAGSCVFHRLLDRGGRGWVGLAAWGDDPETEAIDGFREGEPYHFMVWNHQADREFEVFYEIARGDSVWHDWGYTRVRLILPNEVDPRRQFTPSTVELFAYPNPFNASTRIAFALPQAGHTTMSVYDLSGREAMRLIDANLSAGAHSVVFDASGLVTGTYFLRLTTPAGVKSQKLLLMK